MQPITRATAQSFCRTCLQEFVTSTRNTRKRELSYDLETDAQLAKWLRITTSTNTLDDYPRRLCHECYMKTRTFYEFREKAIVSDLALKELLVIETEVRITRNLQLFCRMCLKRLRQTTETTHVHKTPEVRAWLLECTGIHIGDDGDSEAADNMYPKLTCSWCFKKLRNFIEFRRVSRQSLEYLQIVLGGEDDSNQPLDEQVKVENHIDSKTPSIADEPTAETVKIEIVEVDKPSLANKGLEEPIMKPTIFAEQLPAMDAEMQADYNNDEHDDGTDESVATSISADSDFDAEEDLNSSESDGIKRKKRKVKKISSQDIENNEESNDTFNDDDDYVDDDMDVDYKPAKDKKSKKRTRRNSAGTAAPKDKIKCTQCGKKFLKSFMCEAHVRRVHEGIEKPFLCTFCPNTYRQYHYLRRHLAEVHKHQSAKDATSDSTTATTDNGFKQHECHICCKSFKRKEHLQSHIQSVHLDIRPFKCNYCEKTFAAFRTRRIHEMGHTGLRPFTCEICKKGFKQSTDLKLHMEQHTTSPDLLCPICKRGKANKEELEQHIAMHEASMQHQCSTCGKIFKKKSHLREHDNAVHLKLRPYKCRHCDHSFGTSKTRSTHERTHTGERPEICPTCGKAFKQRSTLRGHMRKHVEETA